MSQKEKNQLLRQLPSIDELLGSPEAQALAPAFGREALTRAARRAVAEARAALLAGGFLAPAALLEAELRRELAPGLRKVINASGVILHTNLGRAPLADAAVAAMVEVAGYCNLELGLETGARGSRFAALTPLLCELTGAEDAMVVNNCAGAVLLLLGALGHGREAIVSRGELVEIGGGFRIPDVMAQSGVRLREVGTTNNTRLEDYASALGPETALIVKVHRSNFAMVGFCEEASTAELAALAHARGLLLVEDLGSGCLTEGLGERTVQAAVRDGADVVAFSGDKLCGGPQAGVLVGRAAAIQSLARHPLARALRIDKCTAAGLEATLRLHRAGALEALPALRALTESEAAVAARAEALARRLGGLGVAAPVVPSQARVGGGSLPLRALPSRAVTLGAGQAEGLSSALRAGTPPVIARVQEGAVLLDLRAVAEQELEPLAAAAVAGLRRAGRAQGGADA